MRATALLLLVGLAAPTMGAGEPVVMVTPNAKHPECNVVTLVVGELAYEGPCIDSRARTQLVTDTSGRHYVLVGSEGKPSEEDVELNQSGGKVVVYQIGVKSLEEVFSANTTWTAVPKGIHQYKWAAGPNPVGGLELTFEENPPPSSASRIERDIVRKVWFNPDNAANPDGKVSDPKSHLRAKITTPINSDFDKRGWCTFPSDSIVLAITKPNGGRVLTRKLCAGYRSFGLDFFRSRNGHDYALISTAVRSSPRLFEMRIYRITARRMHQISRFDISYPCLPSLFERVNTNYTAESDSFGGLKLTLTSALDRRAREPGETIEEYEADKPACYWLPTRTIWIEPES